MMKRGVGNGFPLIFVAGKRLTGVRLAALAAELCGAADADSLGLCGGWDKRDVEPRKRLRLGAGVAEAAFTK